MVEQLANAFHSRGYHKYSYVIAIWICRDNKVALPFWVIIEQRGANHDLSVRKCHLKFQARWVLSLHIKIPFLELGISMKVPDHKHSLQASERYLKRLAGGVVSKGKIEEISMGREILHETSRDGSISIPDNHLGRFHFFHDLKLEFVPKMIRKIF
jgi:hypothetical protein